MSRCKCGQFEVPLGAASLGFTGQGVHAVTACTPWPDVAMNYVSDTKFTVVKAEGGYVVIEVADRQIALQEGDTLTIHPSNYSITYGEDQ